MEKIIKIILGYNIAIGLALVGVVIMINDYANINNAQYEELRQSLNTPKAQNTAKIKTFINGEKTVAAPKNKIIEIVIDDTGINPAGFSAYAQETVQLKITNNSKVERGLKFEKLDFDSGMIGPGQTKEANIGPLPDKLESYVYKSTGEAAEFSGMLMVLQKN